MRKIETIQGKCLRLIFDDYERYYDAALLHKSGKSGQKKHHGNFHYGPFHKKLLTKCSKISHPFPIANHLGHALENSNRKGNRSIIHSKTEKDMRQGIKIK